MFVDLWSGCRVVCFGLVWDVIIVCVGWVAAFAGFWLGIVVCVLVRFVFFFSVLICFWWMIFAFVAMVVILGLCSLFSWFG